MYREKTSGDTQNSSPGYSVTYYGIVFADDSADEIVPSIELILNGYTLASTANHGPLTFLV